jgi:hypothetical protein
VAGFIINDGEPEECTGVGGDVVMAAGSYAAQYAEDNGLNWVEEDV